MATLRIKVEGPRGGSGTSAANTGAAALRAQVQTLERIERLQTNQVRLAARARDQQLGAARDLERGLVLAAAASATAFERVGASLERSLESSAKRAAVRIPAILRSADLGFFGQLSRDLKRTEPEAVKAARGIERAFRRSLARVRQPIEAVGSALSRGLGEAGARAARLFDNRFGRSLARVVTRSRQAASALQAAFVRSAARAERRWQTAGQRIAQSVQRAAAGAREGFSAGGGGAGAGAGIAGAFSGGGGIVSGLIRTVGAAGSRLVSAGGEIGGKLVAGITAALGGATQVLGTAASALGAPIIGGLTSGLGAAGKALGGVLARTFEAAANAAGGLIQVAGEIGARVAQSLGRALQIGLVAAIGVAVVGAGKAIRFEELNQGFESIASSIGAGSGALERFQEASRGTVSQLDLLQQFNNAVLLGAVKTEDQFSRLIEASRRLGKAVGRDAGDALSDLSIGIGRQSRLILDNLGILVRVTEAQKSYADSVGRTVASLTEAERRQAFLNAAFAAIDERLARLGPEVETTGDRWRRFKSTVEDLVTTIGRGLLPILDRILPPLTELGRKLSEFLSDNRVAIADRITGALTGLFSRLQGVVNLITDRGLGGAFDELLGQTRDLWSQFTARAEAAVINIEGRLAGVFIKARAELASLADFTGLARGTDDERRSVAAREASIARNSARLSAERVVLEADAAAEARAAERIAAAVERGAARGTEKGTEAAITGAARAGGTAAAGFTGAASGALPAVAAAASGIESAVLDLRTFLQGFEALRPAGGARGLGLSGAFQPAAPSDRSGQIATVAGNLDLLFDLSDLQADAYGALQSLFATIQTDSEALKRAVERTTRQVEEAALAGAREQIAATERAVAEQERAVQEAADREAQLRERIVTIAERAAADREAIEVRLAERQAQIQERLAANLERISQQVEQRAQSIIGNLDPGTGEGLPTRFRRASTLVTDNRTRRRRDLFNQFGAGLTSDQLAANDGALLQQIAQQVAAAELGASTRTAEAIAAAVRERAAARDEAGGERAALAASVSEELVAIERETADATLAALNRFDAAQKELAQIATAEAAQAGATLDSAVATTTALKDALTVALARLAAQQKQLDAVTRAVRSLK